MPELTGSFVDTARLRTHCWVGGPDDGPAVLLVHGNLVSGAWWRYVAEALPGELRVVAPDLRGYGRSETLPVDATRGLRDWSDDVHALVEALELRPIHAVGWSLGGGVVQQYAIDHPVASLTLVAPLSPYGYGATKDAAGTPCYDDFAGSGGGTVSPEFRRRLAARDRSEEDPASSPAVIMREYFGPADNAGNVDMDLLLDEVLRVAVGEANYPGDARPSPNWPGAAPGTTGTQNAMSPKYCNLSALADVDPQPPVLWIRGEEDKVVSDASHFDVGTLGSVGAIPDWPGAQVIPPQPQVAQMRAVLERYRERGGAVREVALDGVAHGLPVARPQRVAALLAEHVIRAIGD